MKDSFIFYRSFFEATKPLNNEQKAQLFDAICEYALNQTETKSEPIVKAMFSLIQPQLKANNKKYENGKKGGRPKTEPNQTETKPKPNLNQTETKSEPNVNVNVNENVNVNANENTQKGVCDFSEFEEEVFLKKICNFFSQTTEVLEMRVFSFINAKIKNKEFTEFKKQSLAYMRFKSETGDKIHNWLKYQSDWQNTDWVAKLEKEQKTKSKKVFSTNR